MSVGDVGGDVCCFERDDEDFLPNCAGNHVRNVQLILFRVSYQIAARYPNQLVEDLRNARFSCTGVVFGDCWYCLSQRSIILNLGFVQWAISFSIFFDDWICEIREGSSIEGGCIWNNCELSFGGAFDWVNRYDSIGCSIVLDRNNSFIWRSFRSFIHVYTKI